MINSDLNEYYLKAIFNDEIFTVIRYNKNKKLEEAISFDINNNVYFIGNNHDQGKIIGNGKCLKYDIRINFLKSGYINKNKFSFKNKIFMPNKDNNNLYKTRPNLFEFDYSSKFKCFLHNHNLKRYSGYINCDFCSNYVLESFGCMLCNYHLCKECLFEDENKVINKIYIELKNYNINIVKYKKKELLIKIPDHLHQLLDSWSYTNFHCSICGKFKSLSVPYFNCNSCSSFRVCLECVKSSNSRKLSSTFEPLHQSANQRISFLIVEYIIFRQAETDGGCLIY